MHGQQNIKNETSGFDCNKAFRVHKMIYNNRVIKNTVHPKEEKLRGN
jgi:hypothetical protein